MLMEKSRVDYLDVAKGIAIISVIIGHLGIKAINQVVFTYHLPLFLIITGYFVNCKIPVKAFVIKKIKGLMIPYLITCIVIILLGTIKGIVKGEALQEGGKWLFASIYGAGSEHNSPFYIPSIGAIWYLPASCIGVILLRAVLQTKEKVRPIIIFLLFMIGYLSSKYLFWFPMSIQAGLCSVFFMYMGWLYRKNELMLEHLDIETKTSAIILTTIVWVMFIAQFQGMYIVSNNFGRGIVDIIGTVAASILVIQISKIIDRKTHIIRRIFQFAGRYSLLILCVHIIELDLFSWEKAIRHFVTISDHFYNAIIVFLKPTIVMIIVLIMLRIKWIRKIYGYEKV